MRTLEEAAIRIFGSYNYEDTDVSRRERKATHDVLGDPKIRKNTKEIAESALQAMQAADEDPANQHRWGHEAVRRVGRDVIGRSEVSLATVAMSEVDPTWILTAETEEVMELASILDSCRAVARFFMKTAIQAVDAD